MILSHLVAAAAYLTLAKAQTFLSTVPVIDGNTVVYTISTDLAGGTVAVPLSTLPAAVSTSIPAPGVTTTALATTTPLATTPLATTTALTTSTAPAVTNTVTTTTPRVVGQPEPTTGEAGPTTYRYTTTDANGETTVITDTYTPTYGVTTIQTTRPAGTILPYDVYTSMYGGGSTNQLNGAGAAGQLAAFGAGASAVICVIGGMALLL